MVLAEPRRQVGRMGPFNLVTGIDDSGDACEHGLACACTGDMSLCKFVVLGSQTNVTSGRHRTIGQCCS